MRALSHSSRWPGALARSGKSCLPHNNHRLHHPSLCFRFKLGPHTCQIRCMTKFFCALKIHRSMPSQAPTQMTGFSLARPVGPRAGDPVGILRCHGSRVRIRRVTPLDACPGYPEFQVRLYATLTLGPQTQTSGLTLRHPVRG